MITKFYQFILENNRQSVDLEKDFEPTEPVLQKIYYKELRDLYSSSIPKYKLIMNILHSNKAVSEKRPTFTFFKNLLKLSESDLVKMLKNWVDLEEEDFYLPDIKPDTRLKIK
jgi:hypothetical protein